MGRKVRSVNASTTIQTRIERHTRNRSFTGKTRMESSRATTDEVGKVWAREAACSRVKRGTDVSDAGLLGLAIVTNKVGGTAVTSSGEKVYAVGADASVQAAVGKARLLDLTTVTSVVGGTAVAGSGEKVCAVGAGASVLAGSGRAGHLGLALSAGETCCA